MLNSYIYCFSVDSLGFFMYSIMSSVNNHSFTSSFPIGYLLFLVWLLWLGLSVPCWIRVVKADFPFLFFLVVVFAHWVWCWLWVFHIWPLLCWGMISPTFLRVFIINGCWILSNVFSASIDRIMWFLSFILIMHLLICKYCTKLASAQQYHLIMVHDLFNELVDPIC